MSNNRIFASPAEYRDTVTWNDQDGRPEGIFMLDPFTGRCFLQGAGTISYTEIVSNSAGQKSYVRKQMFVPDLAGTIRSIRPSFGEGWTQFEGILDIPGLSPFRAADIIGGFGYGQGSVSINLFGHLFLIRGSIIESLSGAETDQQSNTGVSQVSFQPAGSTTGGNQPIAILRGGAIVNQGAK